LVTGNSGAPPLAGLCHSRLDLDEHRRCAGSERKCPAGSGERLRCRFALTDRRRGRGQPRPEKIGAPSFGTEDLSAGVTTIFQFSMSPPLMLAAASMTAFQDAQATEWRDVAIGEIPEVIIYRDPRGTFTRSVTITFGLSVLIMLLVHGETTLAIPFYGVGVFMPITIMGLSVRQHILKHAKGRARALGALAATSPPVSR
jgi:hypothetical protein